MRQTSFKVPLKRSFGNSDDHRRGNVFKNQKEVFKLTKMKGKQQLETFFLQSCTINVHRAPNWPKLRYFLKKKAVFKKIVYKFTFISARTTAQNSSISDISFNVKERDFTCLNARFQFVEPWATVWTFGQLP